MHRSVICVLLVAGALVPGSDVSAQAKTARIELRLLEAPSARRNDPRARIYIVDHLHPGDTISRRIGVNNRSNAPKRITLYAGAAELARGEFIPSAGRNGNDLATWTAVTPASVVVPAFKEVTATVKIAVPRDAAPGERYGVVWAQLPTATSTTGGPSEVNRVGIRMYLSVGPGGEPASDFVIDSLTAERIEDGSPVVIARVRNTGGRALDMNGSLRLTNGPGALSAGPFPAKLGTTLGIGQTEPVTVRLSKQLPDGPWDAKIDLHSGLVERSASATILFPHSAGAAKPVQVKRGSSGLAEEGLVALGAFVLIVLLLLFVFFVLRRRREREA